MVLDPAVFRFLVAGAEEVVGFAEKVDVPGIWSLAAGVVPLVILFAVTPLAIAADARRVLMVEDGRSPLTRLWLVVLSDWADLAVVPVPLLAVGAETSYSTSVSLSSA